MRKSLSELLLILRANMDQISISDLLHDNLTSVDGVTMIDGKANLFTNQMPSKHKRSDFTDKDLTWLDHNPDLQASVINGLNHLKN